MFAPKLSETTLKFRKENKERYEMISAMHIACDDGKVSLEEYRAHAKKFNGDLINAGGQPSMGFALFELCKPRKEYK